MAVSTSTTFSNAIPGEIQLMKGSIFRKDSTPQFPVGARFSTSDGRVFRYAHFGADTSPGLLVSQDLSESSVVDTDNVVIAPASAVAVPGETVKPGALGSTYVELTLASVTVNQYAGGLLHITDDTGEGFTYSIRGNTATDDPASGNIRLHLNDRLQVALDATSDIAITGNLYANLEAATAATDNAVAGVSVSDMDVSEAAYGFVQESGVATVLTNGVVVLGEAVELSDAVAGAVSAKAALTDAQVGRVLIVGDDTGYSSIKLGLL